MPDENNKMKKRERVSRRRDLKSFRLEQIGKENPNLASDQLPQRATMSHNCNHRILVSFLIRATPENQKKSEARHLSQHLPFAPPALFGSIVARPKYIPLFRDRWPVKAGPLDSCISGDFHAALKSSHKSR